MNMMKKKLGKTGGFTLVEMLIVVAIIAILIAVSIPLVSQALEKARDATDQANERSAKAEAVLLYMGVTGDDNFSSTGGGRIYDAVNGTLVTGTITTAYGKCTGCGSTTYPNSGSSHTNSVIGVYVDKNGNVTVEWVATSVSGSNIAGVKADGTLNYT